MYCIIICVSCIAIRAPESKNMCVQRECRSRLRVWRTRSWHGRSWTASLAAAPGSCALAEAAAAGTTLFWHAWLSSAVAATSCVHAAVMHQLSTHARLSQPAVQTCAADSLECSADGLCLLMQKNGTEQHAAAASSATFVVDAPEPRALALSRQAGARTAPAHAAAQRASPTAATASVSARAAARTQQHRQLQRTGNVAYAAPCIQWQHASARGVCARSTRRCCV